MGRFQRVSLGRAMGLIAVITLVIALIVQARKATDREILYRAEIARLRAELEAERSLLVKPNFANISDRVPSGELHPR